MRNAISRNMGFGKLRKSRKAIKEIGVIREISRLHSTQHSAKPSFEPGTTLIIAN